MSDDYQEASPAQKLNIASYFIMASPTGEVDEVVADVSKLVNDKSILTEEALNKILSEYNSEQMVFATDSTSGRQIIASKFGQVGENEFLDPDTGKVLQFDNRKRQWVGETDKKQVLDTRVAEFRAAIAKACGEYISEQYKSGKAVCCVYAADNGQVTVALSAKNVNLSNYWSGSWRAVFTFNISSSSADLKASIKLNAHYFEDGNVQLNCAFDKSHTVNCSSADAAAKDVARVINIIETDFQNNLEEMYANMHRDIFKSMRRFLPINRQRMVWNANAHSLASEVSKS